MATRVVLARCVCADLGSATSALQDDASSMLEQLLRRGRAMHTYAALASQARRTPPPTAVTLNRTPNKNKTCWYLVTRLFRNSRVCAVALGASNVPAASRSALPTWSKAQGISAHPPLRKALSRGLRRRPFCFSVCRASILPLRAASELMGQRASFQLPPMSSKLSRRLLF